MKNHNKKSVFSKKTVLATLILASISYQANAISYSNTIDLAKDKLNPNDVISIVNKGTQAINGIQGFDPKDNAISGKINVFIDGPGIGIYLKDGLIHNLGSGSELTVNTNNPNALMRPLSVLMLESGSHFVANNLTINADGKDTLGISLSFNDTKGTLTNSHINTGGNAIELYEKASIIVKNSSLLSQSQGIHLYEINSANIENSTIKSADTGIFIIGAGKLTGKDLSIETADDFAYGMQVDRGGNDSTLSNIQIITNGEQSHGLWLVGKSSTFAGDRLNIDAKGKGANGVNVIDGDSRITNSNIHAALAGGVVINNNNQPTHLEMSNTTVTSDSDFGVLTMGAGANLKMDNVNIINKSSTAATLISRDKSQINGKDITLNAISGNAISASGASIINLEGKTVINANIDANAITTTNAAINIGGILKSQGIISAGKQGSVSINTEPNSQVTGAAHIIDDGSITWKGKSTRWDLTDSSQLTYLSFDKNSTVNFAAAKDYSTLAVNKLDGNALFNLRLDFEKNKSDKINITESSAGQHRIYIPNNGAALTNGREKMTIVKTQDGVATFSPTHEYELGGYLYTLQRVDDKSTSKDWEVVSKGKKITTTSKGNINGYLSGYLMNLAEQQILQDRLGQLRLADKQSGFWLRAYGGKYNTFSSELLDGFDFKYNGVQIGFDNSISRSETDNWVIGGMLGYLDGSQSYQNGSGDSYSYSGAAYATYLNQDNVYVDLIAKYSRVNHKTNTKDTAYERVNGKGDNNVYSLSAEVGKRFDVAQYGENMLYIEPLTQLRYSYIDSVMFKNSNNLDVKVDGVNSWLGRIGMNIGYEIKSIQNPTHIYLKTAVVKEFDSDIDFYLNGSNEHQSFKGHWYQYGTGFSTNINDNHLLFAEVEGNDGNRFDHYRYNVGYRYSF